MKSVKIIMMIIAAGTLCISVLWAGLPPPGTPLPFGTSADRLIIDKSDHTLSLIENGKTVKIYDVSLGRGGLLPKKQEGDKRTPEGLYQIDKTNKESAFHRSFHISYPSPSDLEKAQRNNVNPGGDIMIHGLRNGFGFLGRLHLLMDWTRGCIAVTNNDMDELWHAVPVGTIIEIRP